MEVSERKPEIVLTLTTLHNRFGEPLDLQAKEARASCPNPNGIPHLADPEYVPETEHRQIKFRRAFRFEKPEEMEELRRMVEGATTAGERNAGRMSGTSGGRGEGLGREQAQREKENYRAHVPGQKPDGRFNQPTQGQRNAIRRVLEDAYVTVPMDEGMVRSISDASWEHAWGPNLNKAPETKAEPSGIESLVQAARAAGLNATVAEGQTVVTGRDGSRTLLVPVPEKGGKPKSGEGQAKESGRDTFVTGSAFQR